MGKELELKAVACELPLEDIRNCSSASERPWGTITAVNRQTRRHELWRFDLEGTQAEPLLETEYILHNAIDPAGRIVCYIAPPSSTKEEMSLYVYDLQTSRSSLVIQAAVDRNCVPSWRASAGTVVYHTVHRQVMEVDISSKQVTPLFRGEYPAGSPDGVWIGYREGNDIRLCNTKERQGEDIPSRRWFWEGPIRGSMSWSPDEKFLLIGQASGAFGIEMAFHTIDVKTGRRVRIRQRYLQGLRFT